MGKNLNTVSWLAAVIAISPNSRQEDEAFIGTYFKAKLKKLGIGKKRLAEYLDISRPTLYSKLNGTSPFTFIEVVELMVILQIGSVPAPKEANNNE